MDGSADSPVAQILPYRPSNSQPAPPSGREPLARMDLLKAAVIGGAIGLLLRAGLDTAMSTMAATALGALASGHEARASTLLRMWVLGGVLATLGSGALTAVLVRRHEALWVLVSMVCVALPLLAP